MSIRRAGTIRWLRATLAVALLVAMQPIPVAVGAEQALAAQVAATRVAGLIAPENQRVGSANRFTNSVLLAQQGWTSSEYVVIATGRGWSDALVGTPLAATLKAPLLLSERTALPAVVKAEIKRLGASRAIILGGTGALASGIVDDLVECGITRRYVERIGGADRYVTASKVARRIHSLSDGEGWVALVSGERFTDALSVGPWAGALGAPIVLTKKSSIPATTKTVLTALHPKAVLIVGGSRSIGAKVTKQIPVQWRIAGVDSYDTANLMAEFASDHDFDFDNVYVVSGTDWSSSLSLGALSARTMGLIMPTDPTRLDIHTHAFFDGHCSSIKEIISVGGPGWVAPSVMTEIQQASHTHLNTESLTLITGDLLTAFDGVTTETVTFDDVPVAVTTVVPGQYLVLNRSGARPDDDPLKPGFVRQVLSVEDVGDSLVATTRDAALTEILQKGSVDIQVVPISAQDVRNQYLAKKQIELARAAGRPVEIRTIFPTEQNGAAPAAAGIVTKHFDDERQLWENEAKTASLDSTLSVTVTVMADFEMDIDWFTVQSMYLEVLAIEGLDVELGFKWEDKLDDKEFSLAEIPLGQFGFGIGPIDLGVGIQAKPVIGWEKVTGEFDSQFRLQQSFVGILGVSYVKGSGTTVTHQTSTGFDTQFDAHGLATARPYAGIKVEVVICGSDANTIYVMPDAYLWAQAEGSFHAWDNFAHTSGQLDASLEFGVEWRVGYALDLFGLWSGSDYYSGNIYDKTWTFGTGYVH